MNKVLRNKSGRRIEDLSGKIIGMHIYKELYEERRSVGNSSLWLTECINCGNSSVRRKDGAFSCLYCQSLPKGHAGLSILLARYRGSAKENHMPFDLTREQLKELTSMKCHYCGIEPHKSVFIGRRKSNSPWGEYLYNGIDRKDNDIGYILSNCLPCCEICNVMKSDMSYSNFVAWVNRVAKNLSVS